MLPTDVTEPRKKDYYLKLVGNSRVQDWRWRFLALSDNDAIAMSVEQLSIMGDCQWVTGAELIEMVEAGSVKEPRLVYCFDVVKSVKITHSQEDDV